MPRRTQKRTPRLIAAGVFFFVCTVVVGAEPVEIVPDVPAHLPSVRGIDARTAGTKHHFVGYYGITPWSADGTRIACLQSDFGDRLVAADDRAAVCLVEVTTAVLTPVAETSAWSLQQGAMLHWLPGRADRRLIYNDRIDGKLVSVILDIKTNRRRIINRPIAAISNDARAAMGLNYDRLRRIRPVTGYAGGDNTVPLVKRPDDDGLFRIDLASGQSDLLVSVDAACRVLEPPAHLADQPLWLEHPHFSRDDSRIFFMARTFDTQCRQLVSLPLVIRADGTNCRALLPWAIQGASHYDWLDGRRLVLTREHAPGKWHHLLLDTDDPTAAPQPLAPDVLTRDGHCTISPDGRWMVTDTYPDENRRQHLFIYDVKTGAAARIASFRSPPEYRGDWRCDLHPRWSRDSRQICIDSTHEGIRQVYVIDLNVPG